MTTIVVFAGDTEAQAYARRARWSADRKALLGYVNGTFVVKGRTCTDRGGLPQPITYVHTSRSASRAESDHRAELERDHDSLIRARCRREARNNAETVMLLRKYGLG